MWRSGGLQTGDTAFFARDEIHTRMIKEYCNKRPIPNRPPQRKWDGLSTIRAWSKDPGLHDEYRSKQSLENSKFMIPDAWDALQGLREGQKRCLELKLSPWDKKSNQVYWRGADTGHTFDYVEIYKDLPNYFPRLELIRLSRDNRSIVDARFTAAAPECEQQQQPNCS